MRTFKLTSLVDSDTFDLQSNGLFVADVDGLGNDYSLSYVKNEKSKYLNNAEVSFPTIKLTITFAVSGNKYRNYTRLATFLSKNVATPMILEYSDGFKTRLAKVIFKSITKSQITQDNDLEEKLSLDRITYWYTTEIKRIGHVNPYKASVSITNDFNEAIPLDITYTVSGVATASLLVKNEAGIVVQRILWKPKDTASQYLIIAPSDGKRVTLVKNNIAENGYDLIDKRYQTFIFLPKGEFTIETDLSQSISWSVELVITHFVLD